MEVTGPCAVCGTQAILHTCALCGRHVCRTHFDAGAHACTVCAGRPSPAGTQPGLPPLPDDAGDRFT